MRGKMKQETKTRNLQDITNFKVMNIKECLDALEWNYEDTGSGTYNNIACPCGGKLEFRGFIGTEIVDCQKCGKLIVNLFSPIQVSNTSCTILNPKDFDVYENRRWIAIDGNGGIKNRM